MPADLALADLSGGRQHLRHAVIQRPSRQFPVLKIVNPGIPDMAPADRPVVSQKRGHGRLHAPAVAGPALQLQDLGLPRFKNRFQRRLRTAACLKLQDRLFYRGLRRFIALSVAPEAIRQKEAILISFLVHPGTIFIHRPAANAVHNFICNHVLLSCSG